MILLKSIIFRCEKEEYGISIDQVVSIEKIGKITPIPHLPNYLVGFTRIRGELVPVLDFNIILYNKPTTDPLARIVVLNTDIVNFGLVVSEAKEIIDIREDDIQQVGLVNYFQTKYFTAVANLEDRMITIVNPKVLVNSLEGIREIIDYLHQLLAEEKESNA
ncbi:chemotaxis protein CheW [Ureibacillus sp. FSL K6-3587]|uniref:chemotaxis protein CheW n=1 Tax=Ureibacillus sp. FSL K6-3587 TaxID=2954681 RepID=UPI00315948D9